MNDIGVPPLCFKNFTYLIAETPRVAQDLLQSTWDYSLCTLLNFVSTQGEEIQQGWNQLLHPIQFFFYLGEISVTVPETLQPFFFFFGIDSLKVIGSDSRNNCLVNNKWFNLLSASSLTIMLVHFVYTMRAYSLGYGK